MQWFDFDAISPHPSSPSLFSHRRAILHKLWRMQKKRNGGEKRKTTHIPPLPTYPFKENHQRILRHQYAVGEEVRR